MGSVEKLSRICWSLREHPAMIKQCCSVIKKLLGLETSCKQIVDSNQQVLEPLIATSIYLFQGAFVDEQAIKSMIVSAGLCIEKSHSQSDESTDEETNYLHNKRVAIEHRKGVQNEDDNTLSRQSSLRSVHFNGKKQGDLRDLKSIFNVFIQMTCIDELCVQLIQSELMMLLFECMTNKALMVHNHMMTSLVLSDFLQHLTKNVEGAKLLIGSETFVIVKQIGAAIENNIDNRGVVMKYLRALQNLKDENDTLLREQLHSNGVMDILKSIRISYQFVFDDMIDGILRIPNQIHQSNDD